MVGKNNNYNDEPQPKNLAPLGSLITHIKYFN